MMGTKAWWRLVYWIVLRRLRAEWGRVLLLTGGIALGVSMFLAILYAADASVRAFGRTTSVLGGELQIRSAQGQGLKETELHEWYRWLAPLGKTYAYVEGVALSDSDSRRLSILGVDELEFAEDLLPGGAEPVAPEPAAPDPGSLRSADKEALELPRHPVAWVGQSLGRTIAPVLCLTSVERSIAAPKRSCFRVRPLPVGVLERYPLTNSTVIVRIPEAQKVLDMSGQVSGIVIAQGPLSESERSSWRAGLERLVSEVSQGRWIIEGDSERARRAETLLGAFRMNVIVMVLMTLVVCAFTVFNSAQLSVRALLPDLATLRTLGCSQGAVAGIILSESVTLGALGAGIGLTLGYPISSLTAHVFLATAERLYRIPAITESLSFFAMPWVYAVSFLVGVALSVLGALIPAFQSRRVAPGVRGRHLENSSMPRLSSRLLWAAALGIGGTLAVATALLTEAALFAHGGSLAIVGVIVFLSAPVLLASAIALKRLLLGRLTPSRTLQLLLGVSGTLGSIRAGSVAVATTSASLALLIGLSVMIGSFRSSLETWVRYSIAADFFVGEVGGGRLHPGMVDAITALPGVEEVLRFASREGEVCGTGCRSLPIHAAEVRNDSKRRHYEVLEGTLELAAFDRGETGLVSESAARRYGFSVGDRLTLRLPGFPPYVVTISGIYKDFASERGNVLVSITHLIEQGVLGDVDTAAIYASPSADRATLIELLRSSAQGLIVQDQDTLRSAVFEIFDQTFRITDVLRICVLLVCALGFAVTLAEIARERGRELHTMQVLGATPSTLWGGLLFEGGLIALPSLVLGAGGGLLLALLLVQVINPLSFGWTLTLSIPWEAFAFPMVSIVGASLAPLLWLFGRYVRVVARAPVSEE